MNILYVCNEFPYPPHHGGLIDMWNRVNALSSMGASLDVIATVKAEPQDHHRAPVEAKTASLVTVKRRSMLPTLVSRRPGQVKSRSGLQSIALKREYDIVLMQSEYTSDVLLNPSLRYRHSVIRVDNDEAAYALRAARAEKSFLRKAYLLQDSFKVRRHSERILPTVDSLWFVSRDEMNTYSQRHAESQRRQRVRFVPAGVDTSHAMEPTLAGSQVLFVGNLTGSLNRIAIEWYVRKVHPLLSNLPDYRFLIAGSTREKSTRWLEDLTKDLPNVSVQLDKPNLTSLYEQSAVFVNPMQQGAGVKLKTIECCMRGLPIVSTDTGAEGSGLEREKHFKRANTPAEFAAHVRSMLTDKDAARRMAKEAQNFILDNYDQKRVLQRLLAELDSARVSGQLS